jgi:hypothetical protein
MRPAASAERTGRLYCLPGAPRGAPAAAERGPTPQPAARHPGLPAGADLGVVYGEGLQSPRQHLRLHPAQFGEHLSSGLVEHDLHIGPHPAAVSPDGGSCGDVVINLADPDPLGRRIR